MEIKFLKAKWNQWFGPELALFIHSFTHPLLFHLETLYSEWIGQKSEGGAGSFIAEVMSIVLCQQKKWGY